MPFDAAATVIVQSEFAALDLAAAFDRAEAPAADEALENPSQALAFLFVSPRPCAALDALMGL
ncbi:MAG TPA: hypothetical protein VEY30_08470 [Myxococcaceae bacterium]|nr:hypothetical protein [Myxococcaceae bacterium]